MKVASACSVVDVKARLCFFESVRKASGLMVFGGITTGSTEGSWAVLGAFCSLIPGLLRGLTIPTSSRECK